MDKLKVSILLISYNNFKYIFEALDSIFKQTYSNIQLIISDDGSNDFDEKKLKNYINRFSNNNFEIIINVNKENLGTVKHLEKLYTLCTGELITVIAADDAYADELAIGSLVDEYMRYNGNYKVITSLLVMCDDKLKKRKSVFTSPEDVELINSGSKRGLLNELAYRCVMPSSGIIVQKDVYKLIGPLSNYYNYVEDWTSHIRMVRCDVGIRCLNRITVLHRDGGISHGNTRAKTKAYFSYYQDIINIYKYEILPYKDCFSGYAIRRAEQYNTWRLERQKQDFIKDKKRNSQKIVFYCRKGMIAQGDFSLYYRVGKWLAQEEDILVYCVNNSNQELMKEYIDSDMIFCNLDENNLFDFQDAIFVTSYNQLFFLLNDIRKLKNARIVLLFMHPHVSNWLMSQAFFKSFSIKEINEMLAEYNAYGLMDGSNYYQVQELCPNILKPKFFPVIKEEYCKILSDGQIIDNKCINMAWLGRLDGDKIQSLIYFLDNVFEYLGDLKMVVHLIGDGNSKSRIDFNKYAGKIVFVFNSFLYDEIRDDYLIKNVDFAVAMGISAIDVAKLAIPTVIPIISSTNIREDKFVYIYNIKKYSLGWDSKALEYLECETQLGKDIINDVFCNNLKQEIGYKCYEFVNSEFSIKKHLQNEKELITSSTLTVARCLKNKTIKKQLAIFQLYRFFINKNGTYSNFLDFNIKFKNLKKMSLLNRVKTIVSWFLKRLKRR